MVVVSTKRSKQDELSSIQMAGGGVGEATDAVVRRLTTMSTSSPVSGALRSLPTMGPLPVEIEYMSGRIKRLTPVSLPPPAIFFPPFSPSESTVDSDDDMSDDLDTSESLRDLMGQRKLQHQSDGYPDGVDLSSGDEEGDEPDDSPSQNMYAASRDPKALPNRPRQAARRTSSAAAAAGTARGASKSNSANPALSHDASSVATAGAAESGYSSSDESR
ncbi:hypothetical protein NXS19_009843 [Fusarium pseudograminearum]|nr:hypothetical protein NXS19_009843 [Fusarium pseudograminearum]